LTGQFATLLEHDILMISEWKDVTVEELNSKLTMFVWLFPFRPKCPCQNSWGFWKESPLSNFSRAIPNWRRNPIRGITSGPKATL